MPMTHVELEQYFDLLKLASSARHYVETTRTSPPARRVESGPRRNTIWRFASRKMGLTIAAESSLERNYYVLLEFDPEVIEFWDQPPTIPLVASDRTGHLRRVPYTPDILVLTRKGVHVVQVKTVEECRRLALSNPGRWTETGLVFEDSAATAYFLEMGLAHRVATDSQINPIQANNFLAIERAGALLRDRDYRRSARRLLALLDRNRAMTARSAMAEVGIRDSTWILQMLADKIISANLTDADVGSLDKTWLAINAQSIEDVRKATQLVLNGNCILPTTVATGEEANSLLHRLAALSSPGLSPSRSVRRWRRTLQDAKGDVLSLVPKKRLRGNRGRRIPESEIQLITRVIRTYFMSPAAPSPAAAYRRYLNVRREAIQRNELPSDAPHVSEPTFRAEIERLDLEAREGARGGRRAANEAAPPVPPSRQQPRASRPFQRGHVDHYEADLHTVVSECNGEKITRRLWITALRDEWSGMVLGIAVRLRCPSKVACSLVLRDCVRRHQRLPENIVVDNGKEFDSTYFEVFLARYGVSKQSRPPGAPRFGSTIESLFKAMREFLRTLPGSTKNDDRGRAVSPSTRGQAQAKLDTEATYDAIERFCFEGFNQHPIKGKSESPEQLLQQGLRIASYSGVAVEINQEFLVLSALPVERCPTVDPRRGVRHLDRWFFSSELMKKRSKRVEILEEPWDENRIYALIDGKAFPCFHGASHAGWDYSTTSILRAMLVSEGAEIREHKAKDKRLKYDRIAAAATARPSPGRKSTNERASADETLPPSKENLKPFPVRTNGGG